MTHETLVSLTNLDTGATMSPLDKDPMNDFRIDTYGGKDLG